MTLEVIYNPEIWRGNSRRASRYRESRATAKQSRPASLICRPFLTVILSILLLGGDVESNRDPNSLLLQNIFQSTHWGFYLQMLMAYEPKFLT